MKKKYYQIFTVTGAFCFPLDMLRHDECWPYSQEDVAKISNSVQRRPGGAKLTVTLARWVIGKTQPSEERWASFGWKVDSVSARSYGSFIEVL